MNQSISVVRKGNKKTRDGLLNFKKVSNFILAFIPVLLAYKSIIPGVNLGEFFAIVICFLGLFIYNKYSKKENETISKLWLFYACYIIFASFLSVLTTGEQISDVFVRTIRYTAYLFMIAICSKYIIDERLFLKYTTWISVFVVVFVFVQYFIYGFFNIRVNGYFYSFIYTEGYEQSIQSDVTSFRPTSIFLEPSYIGQYLFVPLAYYLLTDQESKKKQLICSIVFSVGMLLSKSLLAYVVTLLIWGYWLITRFFDNKVKNKGKYFLLILLMPLLLLIVFRLDVVQSALSRMDLNDITGSRPFRYRFSGYEALDSFSDFERCFGIGFGNLRGYRVANYVLYTIMGIGFIGFSIFLLVSVFSVFQIKKHWKKIIFICFFGMCFGEGAFLFVSCIPILAICFTNNESKFN